MKKTIYKLLSFAITLMLFQQCDQIKDDAVPEIKMLDAFYTKPNLPVVLRVDGSYSDNTLDIRGGNGDFQVFDKGIMLYTPKDNVAGQEDIIDISIYDGNDLIAKGTATVQTVAEDTCVNTAFSDSYVMSKDSSLEVDLLQAFCDFKYSGSGGINQHDIQNTENVMLAITPSSAMLTYTPPVGFTGRVEFIYELCYGYSVGPEDPLWDDPYSKCKYYYSALTTIDVVD